MGSDVAQESSPKLLSKEEGKRRSAACAQPAAASVRAPPAARPGRSAVLPSVLWEMSSPGRDTQYVRARAGVWAHWDNGGGTSRVGRRG